MPSTPKPKATTNIQAAATPAQTGSKRQRRSTLGAADRIPLPASPLSGWEAMMVDAEVANAVQEESEVDRRPKSARQITTRMMVEVGELTQVDCMVNRTKMKRMGELLRAQGEADSSMLDFVVGRYALANDEDAGTVAGLIEKSFSDGRKASVTSLNVDCDSE